MPNISYERITDNKIFDGDIRNSHEIRYRIAKGFIEEDDYHVRDFTPKALIKSFIDKDWELYGWVKQKNIYGIFIFKRVVNNNNKL